ncbi:CinA family protein [Apilactobacillus ozensis]|uniref:CinA domain-containing protein n=1 Tax=Apilactobacillus ozensis DSM 23829 = JCM 17196 TaxID=1423781 RepID=A0A0R2ANL3_9LACO|nr:nicotinamide-nucleotide amidohydrolase family protein [Apilactobacillus ozensis]KRM68702.1 CinA domain-containing protein [Apilactobacillus ozensis DSM 23829 = JCM 17196]MCK8607357.1 nicotinamide-nucleotide amidohydrolase family protein [Apilactobacillus ozensis]
MITKIDKIAIEKLINADVSVTAAESLTAGLFQEVLGEVPGVSKIFSGGFVTYSNTAKEKLLGIPSKIINDFGVVSAQTAKQMAQKSREIMKTNLSVSFTGVAGPDELEGNKAGTVYIGISYGNYLESRVFHFRGDRDAIRIKSVVAALDWIDSLVNN